jgi:hypothetical protein
MHVAYEVIERVVRTMPHVEREPNCWVCVNVDAPRFVDYWLDQIHRAAC